MKVVLTGPHCCGKTTVLKALRDTLKVPDNVGFLESFGKDCPIDYSDSEFLRSHPETEVRLTYWMLSDLVKREVEGMSRYEHLVLDRCIVDQIVYPVEILGKDKLPSSIDYFVRDWTERESYSHVFLFPANPKFLAKGGTKDKNKEFQQKIADLYCELLDEYKIRYELLPVDQEVQIQLVSDYLRQNLLLSS